MFSGSIDCRAPLSLCILLLAGCGSGIHGFIPDAVTDPGGNVSGNWQFTLTPAANTPVLTSASGSLDEGTSSSTLQNEFTTAVLLVSGPCYLNNPQVPIQGFASPTTLTLSSFEVSDQYLMLTTTVTGTGGAMAGTYAVTNGCAAGAKGSVTGTRYAPLTGTYAGPTSGGGNLSMALNQSTQPVGDGTFLLSGTVATQGFSCFNSGKTATPPLGGPNGSVSGASAQVEFTTNEAAESTLVASGSFDATAKTFTVTRYIVRGGACAGQTGSATLALEP